MRHRRDLLIAVLLALPACEEQDPESAIDATTPADAAATPADARQLPDAGADAQGMPPGPPVACGAVLPGPPMKSDLIEAQPGYAAEAAALDLTAVPDPFDFAKAGAFQKAVINYMLGRAGGDTMTRAQAKAAGALGSAVLAAAAKGVTEIDFSFLRRGLHYAYPCSRPVPKDLVELRARYGDYSRWPTTEIDCSRPKNGPRRLRASGEHGVYVAETLVGATIRETEVLFTNLRGDGQLDFAAYTEAGELTDRSTFATATSSVTSAAPYTCLSCHYDRDKGDFSLRLPQNLGAGCK